MCLAGYPSEVFVNDISGFTGQVFATSGMWQESMRIQSLWRREFADEKTRVQKMKDEFASAHNMKNSEAKIARLQQLEEVGCLQCLGVQGST